MNIAIDTSPLQSGHSVRGTGFYLTHLRDALREYCPQNNYLFFSGKRSGIPESADVVHYPYFDPFFLTLPFMKHKKTVVTIHDLTPLLFPQLFPVGKRGMLKWWIQRFLIKQTDAIITDSESSKRDILRLLNIPQEKIHVVYLAAEESFTPQEIQKSVHILRKYNLPKEFVLYVGDATPNKNLPRLIDAMSTVSIPIVMVGKALGEAHESKNAWGKDIVYIQEKAMENKKIIRLGFVSNEELIALYNSAKVFVMPSLYEGFGLPILEAMQCGCPVVTTKQGSLSEIAAEGVLYVDAYNTQSIAQGIEKVIADRTLQEALAKKGFTQARKFSWKETAERTMQVYEKVFTEK